MARDSKISPELRNYSKFEDELKSIKHHSNEKIRSESNKLVSEELDDSIDNLDEKRTFSSLDKNELDNQTNLPDLDSNDLQLNESSRLTNETLTSEIDSINQTSTFNSIYPVNQTVNPFHNDSQKIRLTTSSSINDLANKSNESPKFTFKLCYTAKELEIMVSK